MLASESSDKLLAWAQVPACLPLHCGLFPPKNTRDVLPSLKLPDTKFNSKAPISDGQGKDSSEWENFPSAHVFS